MAAFYIVVAILYCHVDTEELSNEVHLFMWQLKGKKELVKYFLFFVCILVLCRVLSLLLIYKF